MRTMKKPETAEYEPDAPVFDLGEEEIAALADPGRNGLDSLLCLMRARPRRIFTDPSNPEVIKGALPWQRPLNSK
jgi:hypothetical protein